MIYISCDLRLHRIAAYMTPYLALANRKKVLFQETLK